MTIVGTKVCIRVDNPEANNPLTGGVLRVAHMRVERLDIEYRRDDAQRTGWRYGVHIVSGTYLENWTGPTDDYGTREQPLPDWIIQLVADNHPGTITEPMIDAAICALPDVSTWDLTFIRKDMRDALAAALHVQIGDST